MIILKSLLLISRDKQYFVNWAYLLQRSKSEGLGLAFGASTGESFGRGQGMCFPKQPLFWGWSLWLVRFF